MEEITKWGDMRRSSNLLGRQLLLARRLCERGCGFVTVCDAGWDMHSNGNSPKNLEGIKSLGPQVDQAAVLRVAPAASAPAPLAGLLEGLDHFLKESDDVLFHDLRDAADVGLAEPPSDVARVLAHLGEDLHEGDGRAFIL